MCYLNEKIRYTIEPRSNYLKSMDFHKVWKTINISLRNTKECSCIQTALVSSRAANAELQMIVDDTTAQLLQKMPAVIVAQPVNKSSL